MEKYPNFREYFTSRLWAIRPEMLSVMCEVVQMRANGQTFSAEEIRSRIAAGQARSAVPSAGSIAVLPLYGVIDQKVSFMQQISGGTSIDEFMSCFRDALADDNVSGIVLDVDSPGGSVAGIQEAANEIYSARGKKPIIAVANSTMASAAYWIACAASEVYCMQSGMVGSVGVIAMHDDYSKANEIAGYTPSFITYGQYKAEGNSDGPLTEDARAYRQGQVKTMGDMFTAFVAKARKIPVATVRGAAFGEGRMLLANDAKAAGMIDGIATIDQAIQSMAKGLTTSIMNAVAEEPILPEHNLSNMKIREATEHVLVGLSATLDGWGTLVEGRVASGKQLDAILSKNKTESIIALKDGLATASERVNGIIAMAGIGAPVQPKEEQPIAVSTDAPESTSSLELERSRLQLTMTLHNRLTK